ncbi:hypothetical protein MQX03_14095 [Chryseobacterium aahli]|uniref:hypothetical protein n=1 Tax=Chryseobacterium aahli TaxID=1278643 RepID=UPI001F5FF8C9|nr:hypothetical protein [Chryseobacterium aahli]MCI3938331.1 hypothetical protein [Chryseobacterium aahli]
MKITRLFLFLSLLFFSFGKAQLSAFINGKEVKSGATISKDDLETLQVSFKKPKNVIPYSGYSHLYVEFADNTKTYINHWGLQKDGYTAMEDFLKSTPATKKFTVFEGNDFITKGNNLEWIVNGANGVEKQKSIRVEIGLWVKEETGYKQYGQKVQLLEPIFFNVPIWDTKNLYLPYLDATIDKTNIKQDIDTDQTGSTADSRTEVGYAMNLNQVTYLVYTFEKSSHPGLTVDEVAKDFIHKATYDSNGGKVKKNHEYDFRKYELPWDNICDFFTSQGIQNVAYYIDKSVKSVDLMGLYQEVEFGKMKGYSFQSGLYNYDSREGKLDKDVGQFKIYILNHPTNPDLILMVCNKVRWNKATVQDLDTIMQTFIKSIKQ